MVDSISIELYFEHTWPCDLKADLIAPTGESFNLNHLRQYQSGCGSISEQVQRIQGSITVDPMVSFNGTWELNVYDDALHDTGSLYDVKVNFYGTRD